MREEYKAGLKFDIWSAIVIYTPVVIWSLGKSVYFFAVLIGVFFFSLGLFALGYCVVVFGEVKHAKEIQ